MVIFPPIGLGWGDYTEHLHTYDTLQSTLTKTDLTLFLSLGKEWQEQFNQFQLFCNYSGVNLAISFRALNTF
ncbi:hypothetical protein BH23BAC1_BH23BAC1_29130 [soil metagenome]